MCLSVCTNVYRIYSVLCGGGENYGNTSTVAEAIGNCWIWSHTFRLCNKSANTPSPPFTFCLSFSAILFSNASTCVSELLIFLLSFFLFVVVFVVAHYVHLQNIKNETNRNEIHVYMCTYTIYMYRKMHVIPSIVQGFIAVIAQHSPTEWNVICVCNYVCVRACMRLCVFACTPVHFCIHGCVRMCANVDIPCTLIK